MPKVRLPLATSIESRDSKGDKDAFMKNAFVEMTSTGPTVVKRPGLDAQISAYGKGLGGLWYNGALYSFTESFVVPNSYAYVRFVPDTVGEMIVFNRGGTNSRGYYPALRMGFKTPNMSEFSTFLAPTFLDYFALYRSNDAIIGVGIESGINGLFVKAIRSEDLGDTWEEEFILPLERHNGVFPVFNKISNIVSKGSDLYIFGSSGDGLEGYMLVYLKSSDDGRTWSFHRGSQNFATDGILVEHVCRRGGSNFWTSGRSYSVDLVTWSPCVNGTSNFGCVWTGDNFIAVNNTQTLRLSPDGITWTTLNIPGTTNLTLWNQVYYNPDSDVVFVWAGREYAAYSNDHGATWTMIWDLNFGVYTGIFSGGYQGMTMVDGEFHILCVNLLLEAWLISSPDGANWTPRNLSEPTYTYNPDIHYMD